MSLLERAAKRIQMMVAKALINAIDDSNEIQLAKITIMNDEVQDGIERIQPYGVTTNPPKDSEAVVVYLNGNRDHGVIIACDNGEYRPTGLSTGEVLFYAQFAQKILFRKDGDIVFNNGTDYGVAYEQLKQQFDKVVNKLNSLIAKHNSHSHTGSSATGGAVTTVQTTSSETAVVADLTPAKVGKVRL